MEGSALAATCHDVLQALAQEPSDEVFFVRLVSRVRGLIGGDSAALLLLDEAREQVELAAVAGDDEAALRGTRLLARDSPPGRVALTGEPQLSATPPSAMVPVFHEGQSVGALIVQGGEAHIGGALLLLHTLAATVAARLKMIQQRRTDEENRRVLAALAAVEKEATLDGIARIAAEHLDVDAVALLLFDEEGRAQHVAADVNLPENLRDASLDASEETIEAWVATGGFRLLTQTPLQSRERTLGNLLTLSFLDHPDPARPALVRTLARAAAALTERTLLREEAARRADEATTLYELSQALGATLKLPEAFHRALDALCMRLSVEKGALFLKEGERLRLAASRGLSQEASARLKLAVGEGLPGWVVQFQTPTASEALASDLRNASFPLEGEGASLVAAPLQVGTETIGVLCGLSARPRRFTVSEIELAYTIANHSAVAIDNARIYAETRRQSVALRRYLQGVAHALTSPQAAQRVPEVIASLTREALGADRAALYLVRTEASGALRVEQVAAAGYRAAEPYLCPEDTDFPAAWVARKGRSLSAPTVEKDARFGSKWERPRGGSYAAVPLRTDGDVLGVLEVVRRVATPAGASDLRQLGALARHAALAVEGMPRRRKR